MCGICGSVGSRPDAFARAVEAQLDCQRHRGPDAEGYFDGGRGVVAQNRLSIIDLVHGDPPLTNEDGTVGAVLNGEIYNFKALRSELEARGHRFSSTGDTEVLAHLAEDRPPVELAAALDGMFAFAVWDERRERLVLGRDRLGKKPLYYAFTGSGELVFASEIKALFVHPGVSTELDEAALPAYLAMGYVPTPKTFYRGILSLPPGHVLTAPPGRPPLVEPYWEPELVGRDFERDRSVSLEEASGGV